MQARVSCCTRRAWKPACSAQRLATLPCRPAHAACAPTHLLLLLILFLLVLLLLLLLVRRRRGGRRRRRLLLQHDMAGKREPAAVRCLLVAPSMWRCTVHPPNCPPAAALPPTASRCRCCTAHCGRGPPPPRTSSGGGWSMMVERGRITSCTAFCRSSGSTCAARGRRATRETQAGASAHALTAHAAHAAEWGARCTPPSTRVT